MAGNLISSFEWLVSSIYRYPNSQLALQTSALCRQVARCAGESWPMLDSSICNATAWLLHRHGQAHARSKPSNPHAALLLFEEATSLLVPGISENTSVCWLTFRHLITLCTLGRLDEARAVVMEFIECIRRDGWLLSFWKAQMKALQLRGIWPSQYDYLLDREEGDLPYRKFWRQDQSLSPLACPSLSESLPSSRSLDSSCSGTISSPPRAMPVERRSYPIVNPSPGDNLDASDVVLESINRNVGFGHNDQHGRRKAH